jgi:DNA-directed RNA polymerase subunit beta'
MLSTNNILHPASVVSLLLVPSQDIVLGLYYLTKPRPGLRGQGKVFASRDEAIRAYENGWIDLNAKIKLRLTEGERIYRSAFARDTRVSNADTLLDMEEGKVWVQTAGKIAELVYLEEDTIIETTVGRVYLNEIVPSVIGYANDTYSKKVIGRSVDDLYRRSGNRVTVQYLDNLKDTGYFWATRAGVSVAISDMIIPDEKYRMISDTETRVEKILDLYNNGVITEGERYNQVIDAWSHTTNDVANLLFDTLSADKDGFNSVFMMADSGARGSREQIKQLSGMRGLMQKPTKKLGGQEVIENPIKSCFREGLNVLEYFISTHGARKGLADTALKTADAGYLTRRLVDVAQDLVVSEWDCGTTDYMEMMAARDGDDIIQDLDERILGRVIAEDVLHPVSGDLIIARNDMVDEKIVKVIMDAGIDRVKVRSVLTCESRKGVCSKCYGRNLANGRAVDLGEAIGVIAAQSIGEPGTQLTLRTFHIGGASSRLTVENSKKAQADAEVILDKVETVEYKGKLIVMSRSGEMQLRDEHGVSKGQYDIPHGATLRVQNGEQVKKGAILFEWDPYNSLIIANGAGTIEFDDLVEDSTYIVEYDDTTGLEAIRVISDKKNKLRPHVNVLDANGDRVGRYAMPDDAYLMIKDKDVVEEGQTLAKLARAVGKTRDITGGLPRVAELFEGRKPKNPSVIAPIEGIIEYGKEERGNQRVIIKNERDEEIQESVLIPRGKHLSVHPGDKVRVGEKLCDGSVDPHDILRVLGVEAVQRHVVDEIQSVYRLQGVGISDKHIECIVRQMMRKVRVKDPGDTRFLPDEEVSKTRLRIENDEVKATGGKEATYIPMMLGITKSSLGTDSFISAASFQETTKILTKASVEGASDELIGLKENVILGRLIPSGTGASHLRNVVVKDLDAEEQRSRVQHELSYDMYNNEEQETEEPA